MKAVLFVFVVALSSSFWRASTGATCQPNGHRSDCGYVGIDEQQCTDKGCCWSPKEDQPYCFYKTPEGNVSCHPNSRRTDCGYVGIDEATCKRQGCCWSPEEDQPYCFNKTGEPTMYMVENVTKTALGVKIFLNKTFDDRGYGDSITPLVVEITAQTAERLHVKLYDPNHQRWEVPSRFSGIPEDPSAPPSSPLYSYSYSKPGEPFSFEVSRLSNEESIFKTATSMEYADQFLELETALPDDHFVYGLGDHVTHKLRLSTQTYTLWNFDIPLPHDLNIYGSHPFYLEQRTSGFAHGVYLRNSNGMDIVLEETSLTYRAIGGVLDFYFFLGPLPEAVIQQYQEVIGRPHFPPFWALGFHQCRFGYENVDQLKQVVHGYASAKIPLDTMWTDINYMNQFRDFTLDPVNFPPDELNQFVDSLHDNGQHYVVIVDPGIQVKPGYGPYDDGIQEGIFLKDSQGNIFTGRVWPGICAFVDYMNPKAQNYWQSEIAKFLQLVPVDGLWIDMNEPSNFCDGECADFCDAKKGNQSAVGRLQGRGTFGPSNPPYAINNRGNHSNLHDKTTDMDVTHCNGQIAYNTHNIFGLMEAVATNYALQNITGKRSFVISRSTFPGSGHHTGHWTGDNTASWDYLVYGLPHVLSFQLFGIPLVGNDICGFIGDTTEELCSRWIEVAAFFPFSRNHNTNGSKPQELYLWESVAAISRRVLSIRYSLLPYYYTLFYKANQPVDGTNAPAATILRPLFFEFPDDRATYTIDRQFLVGSGFLVSPVLEEEKTSLSVYFPSGRWYDVATQNVTSESGKETQTLDTPLDQIQLHYRGGTIFPMLQPGLTTTETRKSNFTLLVALDASGNAAGDLFWDDGEQLKIERYIFVDFKAVRGRLTSSVSGPGGVDDVPLLETVLVLGVPVQPRSAAINGSPIPRMSYNSSIHKLTLPNLATPITKTFTITWQ